MPERNQNVFITGVSSGIGHALATQPVGEQGVLDTLFGSGTTVSQVVAISSGASVNGNRGWAGYSLSKAALNMLVRLYSREQPQTHFAALAPGIIDTAMQEELCSRAPDERYPSIE